MFMDFKRIFNYIPEVTPPEEKKLAFNVKLKWTLIVLAAFFILANVPLYALSVNALERFKYLAIILQLLTGAGIINIETNTVEGKKFFQGLQKLLVLFFIIFEASVYVLMNG